MDKLPTLSYLTNLAFNFKCYSILLILNKVLSGKAPPQFLQGPLGQTAASESQILL